MDFFQKSTAWLAEKAGAATIDWTALASRGQDSVFNTAYLDQYMLPAFERCSAVVDTLELDRTTTTEAISNYFDLKDKFSGLADSMLKVIGVSVELANPMNVPKVTVEAYNHIIWYMWAMALTGANMHVTGQIQKSGISDEEIAYHASLCTMMFNVITRLNDFGLLISLKKSGTSGLGAFPLVALIVLGAIAIVAVAWAIVAIFEISQRNEVVKAACVKATDSGDPAAIANCQKLFSSPEGDVAGQIPRSIADVVQKIAVVAMVGAGVYVAVLFGPSIATKVKQTFGAWKAA